MLNRVAAVRSFNRFYTKQIGLLGQGVYQSRFSLAEGRVLRELACGERSTAGEIGKELGLDAGYLSRILSRFHRHGLIRRQRSTRDGRQNLLTLTAKGRKTFAPLEARANHDVAAMLERLPATAQERLTEAMRTIEDLLDQPQQPKPKTPYVLRPPRPGDMGWLVHRHGVLYSKEYGWGESFEGMVAEIAARFLQNHDPRCERCWMAEKDGAIAGSVLLVKETDEIGRLRVLLVEPEARGLGIGKRLVEECIGFARQAGYRKIVLFTQSVLHAARAIYEAAGFRLVREEPEHSMGPGAVGQTWELTL